MELLEGQDLSHLLKTAGALTVHDAVTYVLQACEAVAEAHASGVVHRDLKPANLFLAKIPGGGERLKVLDFGISKLEAEDGKLTQTDQCFGSPLYMSPELMKSAKHVDGRADVWALGVILYELLCETTPFKAETTMAVGARILTFPPTPLAEFRPDVPGPLVGVIMQCLEKDKARRWANVADFAAALAPYAPPEMLPYVGYIAKVRGVTAPPSRPTDMLPPEPSSRQAAPGACGARSAGAHRNRFGARQSAPDRTTPPISNGRARGGAGGSAHDRVRVGALRCRASSRSPRRGAPDRRVGVACTPDKCGERAHGRRSCCAREDHVVVGKAGRFRGAERRSAHGRYLGEAEEHRGAARVAGHRAGETEEEHLRGLTRCEDDHDDEASPGRPSACACGGAPPGNAGAG